MLRFLLLIVLFVGNGALAQVLDPEITPKQLNMLLAEEQFFIAVLAKQKMELDYWHKWCIGEKLCNSPPESAKKEDE